MAAREEAPAPAAQAPGPPAAARAPAQAALLLSMDDFANFKQIGKGKDSVVYSATCAKLGGGAVVLKVYDKARISAIKHRSVRREARIMRFLTDARVPHCCYYIGAFQDSKQIYIVMEHCAGGDLLEQLLKEGRAMTEKRVVREVVVPILTSLAHLHGAGIIHRDIKLENLFVSPARGIMLGDFGLALCVHEEKPISPVGTLEYMPPEILKLPSTDLILSGAVKAEDVTPVDEKVDQWSFGVTVYELVTGRSPFEGASKDEIRANILAHNMRPLPAFLTPECADWVGRAMTVDPGARPSALQLLRHRWVVKNLHAEDAARLMDLRVATPRMLPAAAPAAPAAHAAPAAPAAAGAEAAGAGDAAASKMAAKGGAASPRGEAQGGSIPAYVPAAHGDGGGAAVASVVASSGSTGSSGSAASVASLADSATSVPAAAGPRPSPLGPKAAAAPKAPAPRGEPIAEAAETGACQAQHAHGEGREQCCSPQQHGDEAGAALEAACAAQRKLAGSPDGKGGKKKPLFKWMCIAGKESL